MNIEPSVLTLANMGVLLDKLAADGVTTISTAVNWSALQPQSDSPPRGRSSIGWSTMPVPAD